MKIATKWLLGCFIALGAASSAGAAVQASNNSTVAGIESYTEYGGNATVMNGDVIFQLTNNGGLSGACPLGFWIRGSDIGARNAMIQILAAYHAGRAVTILADTSTIWPGNTSSPACLVWSVQN
jgi:hypothetical protein